MCAASRAGYNRLFARLGVSVTERGESSYVSLLPGLVARLVQQGLAVRSEGALVVPMEPVGTGKPPPPMLVQKSDGGYVCAPPMLVQKSGGGYVCGVHVACMSKVPLPADPLGSCRESQPFAYVASNSLSTPDLVRSGTFMQPLMWQQLSSEARLGMTTLCTSPTHRNRNILRCCFR